ncbi:MAG: DUF4350 domain-containing protein [Cellulophaga sp.]
MDKRLKIIIGIFATVLLTIIVTEFVRPKPINWSSSYTSYHKRPFGSHILTQELPSLFPNRKITVFNKSCYQILTEEKLPELSNYIFINTHLAFDKQESNKLLEYAAKGNTVFLAATYFSGVLADTLNINATRNYGIIEDTIAITYTNKHFSSKKHLFSKGLNNTYFNKIDTVKAKVLSYTKIEDENKEINFIEMPFGKGKFLINTTPQAFGNYYMLKGNTQYIANAFSYLNDAPIIWDDYKKEGRVVIKSPMRFVLTQASLKWAYYTTIICLLLFVIFRAKRNQRIIPVIEPLKNSSVEFAKTVGTLYYQHRDFNDIIAKKSNFFTAFIRTNYYLNITSITEKTAANLAAKSGKTIAECKELLEYLIHLKNKKINTEHDLIALNKKIAAFKK